MAKEELDAPPTIKVWIGDGFEVATDYPVIKESPYLDDDQCYVMAGVGISAGKKVHKRIWELGYIPVWDENPQSYDDPLHRNKKIVIIKPKRANEV